MTRDEIIRMAREAGLRVGTNISGAVLIGAPAEIGLAHLTIDELEGFAALVAAAEREACAKVCESVDEADSRYRYDYKRGALACAAAIRAMS